VHLEKWRETDTLELRAYLKWHKEKEKKKLSEILRSFQAGGIHFNMSVKKKTF
jgi:hypothetical protein